MRPQWLVRKFMGDRKTHAVLTEASVWDSHFPGFRSACGMSAMKGWKTPVIKTTRCSRCQKALKGTRI